MEMLDMVQTSPELKPFFVGLDDEKRQLITGLNGSAFTLMLAAIFRKANKSIVVVASNNFQAGQLVDDLTNILPIEQVAGFTVDEVLATTVAVSSPEERAERVRALELLSGDQKGIVVTSLTGLRRFLPPVELYRQFQLHLEVGADLDLEATKNLLAAMGYTSTNLVNSPGEFATRGDIIDVFPLNCDHPLRMELFDTQIDAIRFFAPESQRSIETMDSFDITPATDLVITKEQLIAGSQVIANKLTKTIKKLAPEDSEAITKNIQPIIDQLANGQSVDEIQLFTQYLYDYPTNILDYLGDSGIIVFDDYPRSVEAQRVLEEESTGFLANLIENSTIFPDTELFFDLREMLHGDKHQQLYFSLFQKGMGNLKFSGIHNLQSRTIQQFFGQMPLLKTELDRWAKLKQTVVILVNTQERADKFNATLHDFEVNSSVGSVEDIKPGTIQVIQASLENGFELPDLKLVILTEREIFNQAPKKRRHRQTMENAERIKSYNELKPGDYVVHVNHGIGKYIGMETLEVDGIHQDYVTILYKDNGKLFIPVTQLNMVQKYVASEGKVPHINKLGGSEWQKTKRKVAAKIEDIADDLIALYAKRQAEKGYAFSKDDDYQQEFEDDFPYTETGDQLRSTSEIKRDMETARPMDRLLVGDVGFGKTEVALRAAFKAIQDNKQVAFLVPTTILAQQHFETMQQRFADFPIEIGMMSRFRTRKQIAETTKGLKNGSVDIVVGTHRLLSKDVIFSDLGLVIIDEEQRFGVKHKERLKELRSQVDVLTLTATPIPRTLNMSMLGVRDLSVIEEPPSNRYPVQTYVMEQNLGAIKEAIERELARGGQVFYLHNRVDDIEQTANKLEALVPNANIAYAHGQMTETQLESVIYDFVSGRFDVLVTTTIIETGVDMPNVNTLIVENADHMGLSQLYQLRGRVGRSSRVAYGYFMYKPDKVLTEVSEKRLKAIKDFTELGSGFKIAMRDLSIRGAGNLLGKQQHGFIDSVGYDLYTQMLKDAVANKRGDEKPAKTDAEINLSVEAFIPSSYIEDERQKIEIYKRIRELDSEEIFTELQEDLVDRFGDYPFEVENLLAIGKLKMNADQGQVELIRQNGDQINVRISLEQTKVIAGESSFKALSATKLKASVKIVDEKLNFYLIIQPKMSIANWLDELSAFMAALAELNPVSKPKPVEE